jgi:hypothetical protein
MMPTGEQDYHRVGDVLAPKAIWNELFPQDSAGLANLMIRIQAGSREHPGKTKDHKNISLQPSGRFKFGAYLSYNDHRDIRTIDNEMRPAERVAAIIDEDWETVWHDAERVFDGVLGNALGEQG